MVGTKLFSETKPVWITALIIAVLIAATACGSGDDESVASSANNSAGAADEQDSIESESVDDDTAEAAAAVEAADTRIAPAVAVVPKVEPEAGSDEAAIIEVFTRVALALRAEDIAGYLEACNPNRKRMTPAQMEFTFDNVYRPFGDLPGVTIKDVTIRLFKDDTATIESIMYSYDDVMFERFSYSFAKVDGAWYAESNCGSYGETADR